MTDDSKFAIRWEINNVRARLAEGKVESGVFNEGGFKWSAYAHRDPEGGAAFGLQCGVDHNGPWKCEAEVGVWFSRDNTHSYFLLRKALVFALDENNCVTRQRHCLPHSWVRRDRGEPIPSTFAAPNNRSDVILVIGEKKLHVNKEYLAVQSPVFAALFFGDYAEKGKDEVEIKHVIYEEFHDLLQYIYQEKDLSDHTVLHILKLADRFQMKNVMERAETYLIQSVGFENKLQIADQYRLVKLRDHCLESFTVLQELVDKCKTLEWADFSLEMKGAIHDRIMKMN